MHVTYGMRNIDLPSLEKPYAHILQPMHKNSFSRNVRLTHILVIVCFTKRPFYVNERTLNMYYSIYTFTMR